MISPDYLETLRAASYGATARLEAVADLLQADEDKRGLSLLLRDISERLLRAVEDETPELDATEEVNGVH